MAAEYAGYDCLTGLIIISAFCCQERISLFFLLSCCCFNAPAYWFARSREGSFAVRGERRGLLKLLPALNISLRLFPILLPLPLRLLRYSFLLKPPFPHARKAGKESHAKSTPYLPAGHVPPIQSGNEATIKMLEIKDKKVKRHNFLLKRLFHHLK